MDHLHLCKQVNTPVHSFNFCELLNTRSWSLLRVSSKLIFFVSKYLKQLLFSRAVAPSWALYKGTSLKSVLDSADWAVESTFAKFYLRDFDVTRALE